MNILQFGIAQNTVQTAFCNFNKHLNFYQWHSLCLGATTWYIVLGSSVPWLKWRFFTVKETPRNTGNHCLRPSITQLSCLESPRRAALRAAWPSSKHTGIEITEQRLWASLCGRICVQYVRLWVWHGRHHKQTNSQNVPRNWQVQRFLNNALKTINRKVGQGSEPLEEIRQEMELRTTYNKLN